MVVRAPQAAIVQTYIAVDGTEAIRRLILCIITRVKSTINSIRELPFAEANHVQIIRSFSAFSPLRSFRPIVDFASRAQMDEDSRVRRRDPGVSECRSDTRRDVVAMPRANRTLLRGLLLHAHIRAPVTRGYAWIKIAATEKSQLSLSAARLIDATTRSTRSRVRRYRNNNLRDLPSRQDSPERLHLRR